MTVLGHDGTLLSIMACPIPQDRRYRLRGARRGRSLPPPPGGPIIVQRRVSSRGGLMVARQKIHAGMIHAGKTATVICENTHFRVVIDGETALVPCTTTSEIHSYKANATHRRLTAGSIREERQSPMPEVKLDAGDAAGRLSGMTETEPKADLHGYLQDARQAVLWKLDGLTEYDLRRPLTVTGTNLLGLVKHLGGIEVGYFGDTFSRPFGEPLPAGFEDDADPNGEFWATANETPEQVVGFYRRACAHADITIGALELDAIGHVPWWGDQGEVTLHRMLVHVIAETNRHAGHADIVREVIDGAAGLQPGNDNLPSSDKAWWHSYRDQLERLARESAPRG